MTAKRTPWHLGRMAAFDVESTGVSTDDDRIITAHVAAVGGGQPTVSRSWTVNPGVPIPAEATAVHKITDQYVTEHGAPPREALASIAETLSAQLRDGVPIVGWNVVFDLSMLDAELARYGLGSLESRVGGLVRPVIDGLVLDKQVDKYRRGSRRLVDVARHYGVDLDAADAHGAAADAMAAVRTVYKIACKYPKITQQSLDDLHDWQVELAAEQQASLEAHFRKTRPDAVVERGWPLRVVQVAS